MIEEASPIEAIRHLGRESNRLDMLGQRLSDVEDRFVKAEHAYTIAAADAFLNAKGSVEQRKMISVVETADLRRRAKEAESDLRKVRSDISIVGKRMEAGRSIVGVLRAEAEVAR